MPMPAQMPDRIIFNEEYFKLCTNPLELYWTISGRKRPRFASSVDCRRGYVATWEIRDNQLFLREIEGLIRRTFFLWGKRFVECSLKSLFGSKKPRVKAVWFSGKLRIPQGKMMMFEDNGYDSRYEKEMIITVTHGDLNRIVTLDYVEQRLTVNE